MTNFGVKGLIVVQKILDFFHSMMIRGLQSPDRRAEDFADLFVLHVVVITHVEDESLLCWQFEDCLLQAALQLIAVEIVIVLQAIGELIFVVRRSECGVSFFAVEERESGVGSDFVEPSSDRGIGTEAVDGGVSAQKGILQHVVGIVVVDDDTADVVIEPLRVGFDDILKSGIAKRVVV